MARTSGFVLAYAVFGILLAIVVFAISVVSLPMLIDRRVDIATTILTSLKVVKENELPMLAWAALIVLLTVLGFATAFVAMIVVFPWLGHASWHAYRDLVEKH
jgi:uncharacterized membrane protein